MVRKDFIDVSFLYTRKIENLPQRLPISLLISDVIIIKLYGGGVGSLTGVLTFFFGKGASVN